jgi:hypothetical protein
MTTELRTLLEDLRNWWEAEREKDAGTFPYQRILLALEANAPLKKEHGVVLADREAHEITAGLFRAYNVDTAIRKEFIEALAQKFLDIEHDTYQALRDQWMLVLADNHNWGDKEREALASLAAQKQLSKERVLLQALRLYQLWDHRMEQGQKPQWVDAGGQPVAEVGGCGGE